MGNYVMFKIGQRIIVTEDQHCNYKLLKGRSGVVDYIETGCTGEAGEEQLVHVKLDNGEREAMFNKRLAPEAEQSGKELKAEGQARSRKRAGSAWLESALAKFKEYCEGEYIHGKQDVDIDSFRSRGLVPEPASVFAWGSLPRAAVKAGFIRSTSLVRNAIRPQAHARPVKVWNIIAEAL